MRGIRTKDDKHEDKRMVRVGQLKMDERRTLLYSCELMCVYFTLCLLRICGWEQTTEFDLRNGYCLWSRFTYVRRTMTGNNIVNDYEMNISLKKL
jgi:hypothetical protein